MGETNERRGADDRGDASDRTGLKHLGDTDDGGTQGRTAISRRSILAAGVAGAASLALHRLADGAAQSGGSSGAPPAGSPKAPAPRPRTRAIRMAHLTDVHLQPELDAEAGFAACLAHVQSQKDRPELIVTGGDNVMDVFEQKQSRAETLGRLWRDTLKRECSLRVEPAIGNHDIWGWHSRSETSGDEALHGKKYALDLLGLERPHRSFDAGGWRIIVLDSIQRKEEGYLCELGPEQTAWLDATLAERPKSMPVLIVSHAPIVTVTPMTYDKTRDGDDIRMLGNRVHADGSAVHALLRKHGVNLCLSGHMHLIDRCTLDGVTYICDGAVSGNWWKGAHRGVAEGYGIVDLYDDGSFEHSYAPFGWQAKPS